MKTIKKMTLVLTALLAVFAFAGCSDDGGEEDESITVTFTYDSAIPFTIGETTVTGIYISEKQLIEDELFQFYFYIAERELETTAIGRWELGYIDTTNATSLADATIAPFYKGSYNTSSSTSMTLNRTHIIDGNATDGWKESRKVGWKTINLSSDTAFSLTLTNDDLKEILSALATFEG